MAATATDAGPSHGRLVLRLETEVLDIGLAGLAIETGSRLIENRPATLRIPAPAGEIVVEGGVVWCFFHGTTAADSGEQIPVYRAGIEFRNVLTPLAEQLMRYLDVHAIAAGESRLFERFRLTGGNPVALEFEAPFRVVGVGPDGIDLESDLSLEALPGTEATISPAGVDDRLVGHVVDLARSQDDSGSWRLRLALEDPESTAAVHLAGLAGPAPNAS